ncbi:MAG: choice-of-anchor V domain-containing protein [Blastocatellia bacterium]
MRNNLLKLSIFVFFCALFLAFGLKGAPVNANSSGPPLSRTGAPGELTCNSSGCHNTSVINSGNGVLSITGLPANYSPDQEVNITVTLSLSGRVRFGFEATLVDDQGRKAGTITVTDSARTQLGSNPVGANLRQYISHSNDGTSGTNQASWTFRWKAPATAVGRITAYVAGNAANNNGGAGGDLIYTTSVSSQPATQVATVATVSAASFAQNVALAPDMIVSGFGTNLSQNVVVASTNPLPTTLDGTDILVRDITNTERAAGLFFVAPTQVNYHIPPATANGPATITFRRNGVAVGQGSVTIESTSPGIFTANTSGSGVPAAVALRVVGTTQTFEPISTTQNGQPVAIPLSLTNGDLYLIGFGTGIVKATAGTVSATIGGTATPILGVAAAPGFVGLDQVNIGPIPKALAGRGVVNVVLTVGGKTANTVTINIGN